MSSPSTTPAKQAASPYIAMEYLDGQSLRQILDSGAVPAPENTADRKPPAAAAAPQAPSAGAPAAVAQATLAFAVVPWGEVFVDGRSAGVSPPLRELNVAPGAHRVEIRNTELAPYQATIKIKPGGHLAIKHRFKN